MAVENGHVCIIVISLNEKQNYSIKYFNHFLLPDLFFPKKWKFASDLPLITVMYKCVLMN